MKLTRIKEEATFLLCKGYIYIPRRVLHDIFYQQGTEKEISLLYAGLLFLATYRRGTISYHGQDYLCESGELITSYNRLADLTALYPVKIQRYLKVLVKRKLIELTILHKGVDIVVINYDEITRNRGNRQSAGKASPNLSCEDPRESDEQLKARREHLENYQAMIKAQNRKTGRKKRVTGQAENT